MGRVLAEGRKPQQTPSQSFFAELKSWSISPPRFQDCELSDLRPGFPPLFSRPPDNVHPTASECQNVQSVQPDFFERASKAGLAFCPTPLPSERCVFGRSFYPFLSLICVRRQGIIMQRRRGSFASYSQWSRRTWYEWEMKESIACEKGFRSEALFPKGRIWMDFPNSILLARWPW